MVEETKQKVEKFSKRGAILGLCAYILIALIILWVFL